MILLLVTVLTLGASSADDPAGRFVGQWAAGPADIEGFITIVPEAPVCEGRSLVVIQVAGPGRVRRISRGRSVEFFVRAVENGYRFSLTPDGEGYRVRFTGEGAFQMARGTGESPDWGQSLQHNPCPVT